MLTATCHCGAVRVTVPRTPRTITDCNCSICRRYGVLWAYYKASTVKVEAKPKALDRYSWGRKVLNFVRCADCGCVMCWERASPDPKKHMGVNARNFEPDALGSVRMVFLDGADEHWEDVSDWKKAQHFMPHVAAIMRAK
jgi:hypothetical protein